MTDEDEEGRQSQDKAHQVERRHNTVGPNAGFSAGRAASKTINTMRTMRCAPDIADVARRGGLDGSIIPYKLEAKDGQLYVAASGNSTVTVNRALAIGFAKAVTDGREFHKQYPEATVEELRQRFPTLSVAPPEWVKERILESDKPATELGAEMLGTLLSSVPYLSHSTEMLKAKPKGRKPSSLTADRRCIIRAAVASHPSGLREYCQSVDGKGISPHPEWKKRGCPATYTDAYDHHDRKWRKLITDEKYKATRRK